MQWKGRTSLLSGTTFLMVQLALHSMSLLRVMEVTHLLGGGLGLAANGSGRVSSKVQGKRDGHQSTADNSCSAKIR